MNKEELTNLILKFGYYSFRLGGATYDSLHTKEEFEKYRDQQKKYKEELFIELGLDPNAKLEEEGFD